MKTEIELVNEEYEKVVDEVISKHGFAGKLMGVDIDKLSHKALQGALIVAHKEAVSNAYELLDYLRLS